ncbi:MAG: hypothetical protein ABIG20_00990 [archaeon]
MDYEKYCLMRRIVLETLDRRGKWGGAHTSVVNMLKKIPRENRGSKETKRAIADLVKERKIMLKKTVEDDHVSLNPRFIKEIKEEIDSKLIL